MICCTAISFFPVCVCCYVFSLPQMCSMAELFATFWTHVWLLSSVRLNVSPENTLQPNVLLHCAHILPFCVNSHTVGSVIITLESVRVWKCENVKVWKSLSLKVSECASVKVWKCDGLYFSWLIWRKVALIALVRLFPHVWHNMALKITCYCGWIIALCAHVLLLSSVGEQVSLQIWSLIEWFVALCTNVVLFSTVGCDMIS